MYQPIPCAFHDVLLAAATRRLLLPIVYRDGQAVRSVSDRIADVYTQEKEEFLKLAESERVIRLDRLIQVGEWKMEDYGYC